MASRARKRPDRRRRDTARAAAPIPPPPDDSRDAASPRTASESTPVQRILFWLFLTIVGLITFGFTPLTYNLDDIKVTLLFSLMPLALGVYWYGLARGQTPAPPRAVWVAAAGYFAALALATLFTPHKWIAYYTFGFSFAAMGGMFAAIGAAPTRRALEDLIAGLVWICLGTLAFGYLHRVHFFGALEESLYGGQRGFDSFRMLLYTLETASTEMMSTILNRDFYAAYLNMMIPVALGLALGASNARRRILGWSVVGLGLIGVLLAMSKNDYVIAAVSPAIFLILAAPLLRRHPPRLPHWPIWLGGFLLIVATILFMQWPLFSQRLKLFAPEVLSRNLEARWIIWRGALGMFAEHPILGVGPGAFRVEFPAYRHPDYFLNDISTVTLFAHNLFLTFLSETGALGFLAGCALLIAVAVYGVRAAFFAGDDRHRILAVGLLTGFAAVMMTTLTSPFVRWPIGGANLFAIMGATVAAGSSMQRADLSRTGSPFRACPRVGYALLAGTALLGLATFVHGVQYFRGSVQNNEGLLARDAPATDLSLYVDYQLRAAEHFERAVTLNPTFITSYYQMGSALHNLSQIDTERREEWLRAAQSTYLKLAKRAPDYSELHFNLGITYRDLAAIALERAAEAEGAAATEYMADAGDLLRLSAEEHWKEAQLSNKMSTQMLAALTAEEYALFLASGTDDEAALAEAEAGLRRAADIYRKVIRFDPRRDDVRSESERLRESAIDVARRRLAGVLRDLGENEEALDLLVEHLAERPGDPEALNLLIEMLERVDDPRRAVETLRPLVRANPLNPVYRLRLGQSLSALGETEAAADEIRRTLRIDPDNEDALEELARLKAASPD